MGWLQSGGEKVWIKLLYIFRSWHFKTAREETLIAKNDQPEADIQNEIIPALVRSFYIFAHNVFSVSGGKLNISSFFIFFFFFILLLLFFCVRVTFFLLSLYICAQLIWCPTEAPREYNFLDHEIAVKVTNDYMSEV